jgi:hydroxyacylglutathione hydrolase
MVFKRFYDEDLAQASYLIGCQATGEAVVVDPRRDTQVYLDEAKDGGLAIVAVTETHIHADYLSGSRELAGATGASLYLSDEGDESWKYGFEGVRLYDGGEITIGNVSLRAVHTPGHTPEHLSFLVTDGANATEPGFLLSGDFVFVGDIGRPDLLDEAAGGVDTRFFGAKRLFRSLHDKFLTLPDYVQVWPGHGAGSACGKALGAVSSTTVGYERRFAWWATYLERNDEEGFTRALLEGQPDVPLYFGRMKRQNKAGPALLGKRAALKHYSPSELKNALNEGEVLIDTRAREAYEKGAVPGSLHLPAGKTFVTHASWLIDPEEDERPLILLAHDEDAARELRDGLVRVGIDGVKGYATDLAGLELVSHPQLAVAEVAALHSPFFLDVRTRSEHDAGHIPGTRQIHVGRLGRNLDGVPKDRPVVVYCRSGNRSAAAASFLRAAGFDHVYDLAGGYTAWAVR